MQPCKSKGLNWPFLRFSGGLLLMQRGIAAMVQSGGNTGTCIYVASKLWETVPNKLEMPLLIVLKGSIKIISSNCHS